MNLLYRLWLLFGSDTRLLRFCVTVAYFFIDREHYFIVGIVVELRFWKGGLRTDDFKWLLAPGFWLLAVWFFSAEVFGLGSSGSISVPTLSPVSVLSTDA